MSSKAPSPKSNLVIKAVLNSISKQGRKVTLLKEKSNEDGTAYELSNHIDFEYQEKGWYEWKDQK